MENLQDKKATLGVWDLFWTEEKGGGGEDETGHQSSEVRTGQFAGSGGRGEGTWQDDSC